jgi:hypothetical protein
MPERSNAFRHKFGGVAEFRHIPGNSISFTQLCIYFCLPLFFEKKYCVAYSYHCIQVAYFNLSDLQAD